MSEAASQAQGRWVFAGSYTSADAAIAALPQRLASMPELAQPARLALQPRHLSEGLRRGLRREAAVLGGLAVALPLFFALAYGIKPALNRWPWLLVAMCAVMFVGAGVAVWWQRRKQRIPPSRSQ